MALAAGSRLGPYEILAPLGAGGMGEVWRARDTRLERTVAIKALPADFAADAYMRARLEREARAISALNDPHICTLYDIGQENGLQYLVMEYVEGESLAERLARGPLPLPQIVRYGIEIAGALERAHKEGIIHRDLKPANIMIARTGTKLLDFGLAKPLPAASPHSGSATKTLTEDGHVVGTLQYMAPEQLEGGEVDHRADLFALGAVLHEMATGRRVFGAETRAGVMRAILSAEPEPIAPPALDRLVRTCLAKDPDARFQSAHDVKVALEWVGDDAGRDAVPAPRRHWVWAVAALLAVVLAATSIALWRGTRDRSLTTPVRLSILPPPGHQFDFLSGAGTAAISPDGTMIIFPAAKEGLRRLWLRRLGSETAEPLPGTEGGANPFWSPDSRSIGFFANEKLMTLRLGGDAPAAVCDAPLARGGSWSAVGTIVFAGRATPIMAVPATGSAPPVAVTELDASKGDTTHRWPFFLPDGRHFLYVAAPSGQALQTNNICVGSIDSKMRKVVITAPSQPLFADGYLFFTGRDEKLYARRFDPDTLAVTGEPIALPERPIELDRAFSQSILSVSPAGTLVYHPGQPPQKTQLIWYSREGKRLGMVGERAAYASMSLSRDARSVYFGYLGSAGPSNIWSYDLETGVKTRLTFGNGRDTLPIVSPDGKRIVYTTVPPSRDRSELRLKDLESGRDTLLLAAPQQFAANDWSPDGQSLLVSTGVGRSSSLSRVDLLWMTLAERKLRPYLQTPDIENSGRFSPDGKWITYQSDQSGPLEVYLAPFPPTGAKWQVSENGGFAPRWRGDGREIYYVAPGGRLMALPITLGATPVIGRAALLFQERESTPSRFVYAATPDGQRFLVNTAMEDEPPQPLTVVLHFDSELRAAARRK